MSGKTFPEYSWGRHTNATLIGSKIAGTRAGAWLIRKLVPLDKQILERSNGRHTILGPIGLSVLLLTTTGRKSGQPRTCPLICAPDGDRIFLAGSNFGQQHHPAWTSNLLADPHATVVIGGQSIPVVATLLQGAERDEAYRRLEAHSANYSAYKGRTDRAIRVFALTRAD